MKSELNRKALLSVPKREWDRVLHGVSELYIIPSGRKHSSGFACMDMVAMIKDTGEYIRCGGGCDVIQLNGDGFRIDCIHPSRIIRLWNNSGEGTFSIGKDLSSVSLVQTSDLTPEVHRIYRSLL